MSELFVGYMKITAIVLGFLMTFCVLSCAEGEEMNMPMENSESSDINCTEIEPIIPTPFTIDLNDDGVEDFEIKYLFADFESSEPSGAYIGRLFSLGENQVLRKASEPTLFPLTIGDIKEALDTPLRWDGSMSHPLISVDYCGDDRWAETWRVWSLDESSSYIMGLKLVKDDVDVIGWMEIELSQTDGVFSVLEVGVL